MSRLADDVEAEVLEAAEELLADAEAEPLLDGAEGAGAGAGAGGVDGVAGGGGAAGPSPEVLRHGVLCLTRALRDVLRVAVSRGGRLPDYGVPQACAHTATCRQGDKTRCSGCGRQLYL